MTKNPDPTKFSVNDKPREYEATLHVKGTVTFYLKADSQEDADAQAAAIVRKIENGEEPAELDDGADVEAIECTRSRPLFRVMREGTAMQVSRLELGDMPREPDCRGF